MEMLEHQAEGQKVHSPPVPLIAAPTSYKQLTVTLRSQWAVHYSMKTDTITNAAQYIMWFYENLDNKVRNTINKIEVAECVYIDK